MANTHSDGILRVTLAPHRSAALQRAAEAHLKRLMRHFDYAGVLTIEFFVRRGQLIANEMAPRVHNSGHWTIEGAVTSQFENHLRAILGWPLGATETVGHSAMFNFIGTMPDRAAVARHCRACIFTTTARRPAPGRKLGHCTIVARTAVERDRLARKVLRLLPR